ILPPVDLQGRLLLPLWGAVAPLIRTLWPQRLLPMYPLPAGREISLLSLAYGGSALLLLALSALSVWRARRGERYWLAAWLYYLATMLPVMGLRQMGDQETADRFAYLPTLSLFLLLGAGLLALFERLEGRRGVLALAAGASALALSACAGMTMRQIR